MQIWQLGIGNAAVANIDIELRRAGLPDQPPPLAWRPFYSMPDPSAGENVLALSVGDWREFTRADYFAAAQALALREKGVLRLLPIMKAGAEEGPQPDPWMERYRLIWMRLAAAANTPTPAARHRKQGSRPGPVSLFFSFSHSDDNLRLQLEHHLSLLERTGLIQGWSDRKIVPGDDWAAEIDHHLYTSDIILLLLSSDFFASSYCSEIETPVALERHKANSARAIPILLRPVVWRHSPLSSLGALPRDAKPVTEWPSADAAFVDVCEGILNSALAWSQAAEIPSPTGVPAVPQAPRVSSRKRALDAAMPAEVQVGRSAMLVVLVRKSSSPGLRGVVAADTTYGIQPEDVKSQSVVLEFPVDLATGKPGSLSLAVTATSPEFDPPTQTRLVEIAPDYDSAPCIFLLAARQTGSLVVLVEAFTGEKRIVSCPVRTRAVREQVEGAAGGSVASQSFDTGSALNTEYLPDKDKTRVLRAPSAPPPSPPSARPPAPIPPPRASSPPPAPMQWGPPHPSLPGPQPNSETAYGGQAYDTTHSMPHMPSKSAGGCSRIVVLVIVAIAAWFVLPLIFHALKSLFR